MANNESMRDAQGVAVRVAADVSNARSNPFSCNVCQRNYGRLDHLARHYRSHTKEKPFVCSVCGKEFGRGDLLKRHIKGHVGGDPAIKRQKTDHPAGRSRVAQACVACAESKLRCEGTNPCPRCVTKALVCDYPSSRQRKSDSVLSQTRMNNVLRPVSDRTSQTDSSPRTAGPSIDPTFADSQQSSVTSIGDSTVQSPTYQETLSQPCSLGPAEAMQLPTPATYDSFRQVTDGVLLENESIIDFNDLALTDFLNDLMMPASNANNVSGLDQSRQLSSRDVLDFTMDEPFTFMDLDGMPLAHHIGYSQSFLAAAPQEIQSGERMRDTSVNQSGNATPHVRGAISMGAQAFRDSLWLWTPSREDNFAADLNNLSFPGRTYQSSEPSPDDTSFVQDLDCHARDKVLAMVLETVEARIFTRVLSSLPSAELMSNLLHTALYTHSNQVEKWLHIPSLHVNEEPPTFMAAVIAFGAVLSPAPELQRLGLALQEAVRHSLASAFERDNTKTRDLRTLQATALELHISLWSGNKRKMEISESFSQPVITMMRRAGHFRYSRRSWSPPNASDDPALLDTKYNAWIEAESFKRLALHFFSRDRQISMSLLNPPLISYAEVSAELPFSIDLWQAKSATEWRDLYLAKSMGSETRLPSLRTCIEDTSVIVHYKHLIDPQMSLVMVLSGIWSLIWHFRERKSAAKVVDHKGPRNSLMFTHGLYQEISQLMQHFQLSALSWAGTFPSEATLLYEQCMMHLHVSLEDVQLLAGKEGEDEARRILPILSSWLENRESRQALFHAGQIIRAAKRCPGGMLRDSLAIAVYHASLVFWAYTVVSRSLSISEKGKTLQIKSGSEDDGDMQPVRLDGTETPEMQQFSVLGKGMPTIGSWINSDASTSASNESDIPLNNPKAVMNAIANLLRTKNGSTEKGGPALVENLTKLMKGLGNAASGIGK